MGYIGQQITTVFPTSISVDSATISGNTTVGGTLGVTGATTLSDTLGVTGVSTLSDNIVFGASGKGVHLGVTSATATNLQDDYEEGSFTATLSASGSTFQYSYQTGRYTKIGNLVNFNLYIQLDGGGNSFAGNAVSITGMPFTNRNNANDVCRYYVNGRYLNVDGTGYNYVYANLPLNSTTMSLNMGGDNVPGSSLPATYLSSSSGQLFMNGHYFTDA